MWLQGADPRGETESQAGSKLPPPPPASVGCWVGSLGAPGLAFAGVVAAGACIASGAGTVAVGPLAL